MIRPLSRTALVLDIVGAFVLFAVLMPASLALYAPGLSTIASEPLGLVAAVAAGLLQCGAVAVGRLAPGAALGVAWVGALVQMSAGIGPLPINIAILAVLYATAAWGATRTFWAGLASVIVGGFVAAAYLVFVNGLLAGVSTSSTIINVVFFGIISVLTLGAPWLGGFGWRMVLRWRITREAQARAEVATAEEQERVRIARDMHDIVAHSLAVIIAQSDGARYAAASAPGVAVETLGTVSQTARAALSDVRMLLTQLRHRQGDGPQPTLADLEQLFQHARQAGLEPRVTIDPMPPGEPPGAVQLAVYRILQEALTNAIRHGTGGVVDVKIAWMAQHVDLEVRNAAHEDAAAASPGGHGIVGMRERAQLIGGVLRAEREGGHFVVHGRLPIGSPLDDSETPESGGAE